MDASCELMTVRSAAAALKVCARTIQSAIARGELPVVRIGRAVRIDPRDLAAYVDSRRTTAKGVRDGA